MDKLDEREYWVPEHVREYLRGLGFHLPLESMEGYIREWHEWMQALGTFYNYHDADGFGRIYEVHRRSIRPAMRVCTEWGSLLLNDKTQVVCESQECTDWLADFFNSTGFMPQAQNTLVRAFGMGTGAWALWVDADSRKIRVRHYDARMIIPLSWDEDGVSECAFVTRAFYRGQAVDQLQMHLRGEVGGNGARSSPSAGNNSLSLLGDGVSVSPSKYSTGKRAELSHSESSQVDGGASFSQPSPSHANEGTYRIVTACFDSDGNVVAPVGVCAEYDTVSPFPTFAMVKPAVDNTRVDMSPYGQSVFADAIDAIQAVDLCFDALINEIDVSKMRVFLSDVLFDKESNGNGKRVSIPFGKQDCTVFRKVMSTEDMIQEFAPALRTASQAEAFRIALQMLGDLTGFGIGYFDLDESRGFIKTATEVSSDNSALMRNIARHEHALEVALSDISHAVLHCARTFGEGLPDEGAIRCMFDDSIITDVAAEKRISMAEVGVTMHSWEYRMRYYGEDENTAKKRAEGLGTHDSG